MKQRRNRMAEAEKRIEEERLRDLLSKHTDEQLDQLLDVLLDIIGSREATVGEDSEEVVCDD